MTATLDATTMSSERRRRPTEAVPRGGMRARWRVAFRLARRQVWRTRLSSLLIVALVALPIAAMSAYVVVAMSATPTVEESTRAELGRMEAWVAPRGVAGHDFWQAPTHPDWTGYGSNGFTPDAAPADDPLAALPAGTETLRVTEGSVRVATPDGQTVVRAWAGATWDPRFAGRFDLVEGRRAQASTEAMVTPSALDRLGVEIGGTLEVPDAGIEYTVVGTLDAASLPDATPAVFLPPTTASYGLLPGGARWYLPSLSLTWSDVEELNESGIVAYSRTVMLDPPTEVRAEVRNAQNDQWTVILSLLVVLLVGAAFAGYVVVMLAGAAFAVTARRQQRSLAIAASVGANPRDLSRTVLLQGTTLGAVGGIVGVGLGLGLGALVMRLIDNGSSTMFWGFHVSWPALLGVLLFAVAVGTASAAVPARALARTDTIGALRGARRPQRPKASRPVWGSLMIVVGVAVTLVSALILAAAVENTDIPWDSPLRTAPPFGIVIGPILAQIGILISGRWLLWMAARALSRVGLAARLAARDAAANAGRTVPAFAAIGAVVFIGVFATAQSSMQNAQTARMWFYSAPVGSVVVQVWPGAATTTGSIAPEVISNALDDASALTRAAGAAHTAVIARQPGYSRDVTEVPDDERYSIAVLPDEYLLDPTEATSYSSLGQDPGNNISVVSAADIETVLGVELTAAQLSAYRSGAAIVADSRYVRDGTIEVSAWSAGDVFQGGVPDNVWHPMPDGPTRLKPVSTARVDALVIDASTQPTTVAIAPETAERLGIASSPERLIVSFAGTPDAATLDRLTADVDMSSTPEYTIAAHLEQGPPSDAAWMIPLLSVVAVLVLGASAVALGLARFERRPDDATLSAVGGTPGLRRRIAFWQGLLIAGFGTLAGAAAGILPPIGFAIQSQGRQLVGDIPWLVLGLLAIGLPLGIAVASWAVRPRHPDLTRRTAIA